MKSVIFNADDLGLSKLTNDDIIRCAKEGVVKSTSLMVTSLIAKDSFERAITSGISVGIHLNATSLNNFISDSSSELFGKDGKIKASLSGKYIPTSKELDLIIEEFKRQLDLYLTMFGKLPDHINHHHPLYFIPSFTDKFKKWAETTRIPIRWFRDLVVTSSIHPIYTEFGFYERENLTIKKLTDMIEEFPDGISEVVVHPGRLDINLESVYIRERPIQTKILTNKKLRDYLATNKIAVTDFTCFNRA